MALAELDALRETSAKYLSIIQESGNNWYLAHAALDVSSVQTQLLKAQHDRLEAGIRKYGISDDPAFLKAVKAAQQLLQEFEELKKLEGTAECGCCPVFQIYPSICGMFFPKSVGLSPQVAQNAYKSILEYVDTDPEVDEKLANLARRQFRPPTPRKDWNYVSLKETERKVFLALEGGDGLAIRENGANAFGRSRPGRAAAGEASTSAAGKASTSAAEEVSTSEAGAVCETPGANGRPSESGDCQKVGSNWWRRWTWQSPGALVVEQGQQNGIGREERAATGLGLEEKQHGYPTIVLLYGMGGKGKSMLARQVYWRYKQNEAAFEQVVFLDCGPEINVQAKMKLEAPAES